MTEIVIKTYYRWHQLKNIIEIVKFYIKLNDLLTI